MHACPICDHLDTSFYVSTRALMHKKNDEQYYFFICNNCETVFLTNPIPEKDICAYYTENYLPYKGAMAWGKYSSFVEKSQKDLDLKRVNFLKKQINVKNSQIHLLDVGCGNPTFLETTYQQLQIAGTGVDFSDEGWRNKNINHIKLIHASIKDFNTSEKFDIITLWHYLEHDYNPRQTIEKLYELLIPGGKLIIEVPDYKSYIAKIQHEYWQGWHSPRHLTLFSAKGFDTLFDKQKWQIVEHFRYGTLDAFTLWWLGRMEKKNFNWSSNMEKEFWELVFLKVCSLPLFIFEKLVPLGIQLIVVERK